MLRNSMFGLVLISYFVSTQASAIILKNRVLEYKDKLEQSLALRDLSERHVFPVYQNPDKQFFVAIRALSSGIKPYAIDNPSEPKAIEQVWQAYITARAQTSTPQYAEDLKILDESTLIGFLVYSSGDWQERVEESVALAPYFFSDEELLVAVRDTVPYFD